MKNDKWKIWKIEEWKTSAKMKNKKLEIWSKNSLAWTAGRGADRGAEGPRGGQIGRPRAEGPRGRYLTLFETLFETIWTLFNTILY